MKILAFSDLHHARARAAALVKASEAADLVIGAGDFCNMRQDLSGAMDLLAAITESMDVPMVVVPGNAESHGELLAAVPDGVTVLHGSGVMIGGVSIFGLGYAVPETPFGGWSCDLSEEQAAAILETCQGADIMVLHSPPKGIADATSQGLSVGSVAIRDAITRVQPQLAVCGHIHDSWGKTGQIGATRVVNLGPGVTWFEIVGAGKEPAKEKDGN